MFKFRPALPGILACLVFCLFSTVAAASEEDQAAVAAPAVAEAAVASGVSRLPLDIASYRRSLEKRLVEISSL